MILFSVAVMHRNFRRYILINSTAPQNTINQCRTAAVSTTVIH